MIIATILAEFDAAAAHLRGKPRTPALASELRSIEQRFIRRLKGAGMNVPRAMRLLHEAFTK